MTEIPGKCRKIREIPEKTGIPENSEESAKAKSANANSYANNLGKSGIHEFHKIQCYIYKPGNSGKSGKFDPVLHLQAHRLAPRVLIAPRGVQIFFFIQGYLEEMPEIPGKCRKIRELPENQGIPENPEESGK